MKVIQKVLWRAKLIYLLIPLLVASCSEEPEKSTTPQRYAFLMIDIEAPGLITELQKTIDHADLYFNANTGSDGIEKDMHITHAGYLDNTTSLDALKEYLPPIDEYEIYLTDISLFESETADVLKCSAQSSLLAEVNATIMSNFKNYYKFKDYSPHVTIAYLKPGIGAKYLANRPDELTEPVKVKAVGYSYSFYDSNDKQQRITF